MYVGAPSKGATGNLLKLANIESSLEIPMFKLIIIDEQVGSDEN